MTTSGTTTVRVHRGVANYEEQALMLLCMSGLPTRAIVFASDVPPDRIKNLGDDDFVLDMVGFKITNAASEVTCSDCLEWMHA